MTLSLNNSNEDFDFVCCRVIKTSWLIYFRSVKFHYLKETHMTLVALVKIVVASQHKRQRKNFSQDLLRNENTDSDLKVHELHYANELLVRIRFAFQKLLQTRQTSRNYQKKGLGHD